MNPQKVQLFKSKRDAAIDLASLTIFTGLVFLVMKPDTCEKMSDSLERFANRAAHQVSIWQTKLAIRSLPETDDR